jgi:hypothetical protein
MLEGVLHRLREGIAWKDLPGDSDPAHVPVPAVAHHRRLWSSAHADAFWMRHIADLNPLNWAMVAGRSALSDNPDRGGVLTRGGALMALAERSV